MNSLFKPYLPVDEEGFVRIENLTSVLDTDFSIASLTRAMRKAEESTEPQAKVCEASSEMVEADDSHVFFSYRDISRKS